MAQCLRVHISQPKGVVGEDQQKRNGHFLGRRNVDDGRSGTGSDGRNGRHGEVIHLLLRQSSSLVLQDVARYFDAVTDGRLDAILFLPAVDAITADIAASYGRWRPSEHDSLK